MSNNVRIVYDNAANRATITASSEAGALVAANLKNDSKVEIWRAAGREATLSVAWPDPQPLGMVAFPFCNLSSTSTIRVRGFAGANDATPVFDTGDKLAVAYAPLGMFGWGTQPIGSNSYGQGSSAYATIWFEHKLCRKIEISLVDQNNPDGYIEAGRLVTGHYWSPNLNADYGASLSMVDTTKHARSDSGQLRTEQGVRARKLTFDLKQMDQADRARMWEIVMANGMVHPLFASLYPEDEDSQREQAHQIYAKSSSAARVSHSTFRTYATTIDIEEV